ncbi:MAG: efflux RND transporter periplasmic adaptor subunit [Phycisphaerales bacterium]
MSPAFTNRMTRFASLIFRILLAVGVLLVAIVIFAALKATRTEPEQSPVTEPSIRVEVIEIQAAPVSRWWEGYGSARAMRDSSLAAQVGGEIVERPDNIEAGVRVEAGDLIARIDPRDYEDRIESVRQSIAGAASQLDGLDVEEESLNRSIRLAEESVRLLRSEMEKFADALAEGGAVAVEVDRLRRQLTVAEREEQAIRERLQLIPTRQSQLQAELRRLESDLRQAELNLKRSSVTAPFGGRLQSVMVERGERVAPGAPIARLVDLSRMEVPLQTPVSAAAAVVTGARVVLFAGDDSERRWEGVIRRVAPEADRTLRTISVFVEVTQDSTADDLLLPGQFVTGRVYAYRNEPSFVAPRGAVLRDRVMLVGEDGRARSQPVEISHYIDHAYPELDPVIREWAVISSGLSEGDRLITSNLDEIDHGMLVRSEAADDGGDGGP